MLGANPPPCPVSPQIYPEYLEVLSTRNDSGKNGAVVKGRLTNRSAATKAGNGDAFRAQGGQADNVGILGRATECAVLDQLIAAVRTGESRVLVVHGAPGIGKSALLDYTALSATDLRVLRADGVESEMELAFATLHQLCAPLLDGLKDLPAPQRDALETVFGTRAGNPAAALPGRAGGAEPPVGRLEGASRALRGRGHAMDGPGLGAGPRLRRPPAAGGVGRPRLRRPPAVCGLARTAGAESHRAGQRRRPRPVEFGDPRPSSTSTCAIGSSTRPEATRLPCWSCLAG